MDKIVLAANSEAVKTVIVGPPTIYGPGRGLGNTRSMQVYDLAVFTLSKGYAPYVGTGKVVWDNVHIHDLSDLFVSLVDAALDPEKSKNPELFGEKAYLFAENGTHLWKEVAEWLAQEAHKQGYISEPKVVGTDVEGIKLGGSSNISWAMNSSSVAKRARKYLGWNPHRKSLKDEIPDVVAGEAKRLGITPKQ